MHTKWDLKIVSVHTSDAMLALCSPSSSNAVPAWPADNTSSPSMTPAYQEAAQPRSSTAQRETPSAAMRRGQGGSVSVRTWWMLNVVDADVERW